MVGISVRVKVADNWVTLVVDYLSTSGGRDSPLFPLAMLPINC